MQESLNLKTKYLVARLILTGQLSKSVVNCILSLYQNEFGPDVEIAMNDLSEKNNFSRVSINIYSTNSVDADLHQYPEKIAYRSAVALGFFMGAYRIRSSKPIRVEMGFF